jgi:CheY-like chemotaxis protein
VIVDEYCDSGEALSRILRYKGYPSHFVASGREAIALLREYPKDQPLLLLLDDMMPGMTGMQTLEAIREDPRISHTAVIMYSAGFDLAHRDEAIALGALTWLLKGGSAGCSIDAVLDSIIEWYERVGGTPLVEDVRKAETRSLGEITG